MSQSSTPQNQHNRKKKRAAKQPLSSTDQARLKAVTMLQQVLKKEQGASLRAILQQSDLIQLSASDRGLAQDLCFGVCRHYRLLNSWIDEQMHKPIKASAASVRLALCCGLYELWFTNRPAHAIVNAWPSIVRQLRQNWATGLINALLRRADQLHADQTRFNQWKNALDPAVRFSLPNWLFALWQQDWPDNAREIAAASINHPPLVLRNNPLKQTRDQLISKLGKADISANKGLVSANSLHLSQAKNVNDIPGFTDGLFSVQDEAAQLPATIMALPPTSNRPRILDACCAPGGKTCQLLELYPKADLTALEINAARLGKVRENFQRLSLNAQLIEGDATDPSLWWDGQLFDAILLDAPCSATGIVRRQPDSKWHRRASDIAALASLQQRLLEALWPLLAVNGCFVYATCSIIKQENSQQIQQFLKQHSNAKETTPEFYLATANEQPGCQWLPHPYYPWDGFYFARLTKLA